MKESDAINKILVGALLLGGLAAGGYYVYRVYLRERQRELATGKTKRMIEVPILSSRKNG